MSILLANDQFNNYQKKKIFVDLQNKFISLQQQLTKKFYKFYTFFSWYVYSHPDDLCGKERQRERESDTMFYLFITSKTMSFLILFANMLLTKIKNYFLNYYVT